MENNNNQPSDNIFTGDSFHAQPASLRGGFDYHNHEATSNDHYGATSNHYGEDTAPFNVAAFLNYLAERDNDFGAACQKYDNNGSTVNNSNYAGVNNDDRSNNDYNEADNDNDR